MFYKGFDIVKSADGKTRVWKAGENKLFMAPAYIGGDEDAVRWVNEKAGAGTGGAIPANRERLMACFF